MQRNKFLLSLVSLIPLSSFSNISRRTDDNRKGFKIPAGEGRYHGHIKLQGVNSNVLDIKISGKDTDGQLAIFEQTSLSPGKGTPLHVHPNQDEVFYVIAGTYYFLVGEENYSLSAGDSIFLPRAVPHAWTQTSEKGKMTVTFQPAGKMEEFFMAVSSLTAPPTPADMAMIFEKNDMKIVGPPLKAPM